MHIYFMSGYQCSNYQNTILHYTVFLTLIIMLTLCCQLNCWLDSFLRLVIFDCYDNFIYLIHNNSSFRLLNLIKIGFDFVWNFVDSFHDCLIDAEKKNSSYQGCSLDPFLSHPQARLPTHKFFWTSTNRLSYWLFVCHSSLIFNWNYLNV